jgi:hypothetical protein
LNSSARARTAPPFIDARCPLFASHGASIRWLGGAAQVLSRRAAVFNAPDLTALTMCRCGLHPPAIQTLIDGLVITNLSTLNVGANNLGDRGISALAMCLGSTSKLRELNIENNRVGDAGGGALARALVTNTSLQRLLLAENCMGEPTGDVFATVVSHHNRTLWQLHGLAQNSPGVSEATARHLNDCLRRNAREMQRAGAYLSSPAAGAAAALPATTPPTSPSSSSSASSSSPSETVGVQQNVPPPRMYATPQRPPGNDRLKPAHALELTEEESAAFQRIAAVEDRHDFGAELVAARRPKPQQESPEPARAANYAKDDINAASDAVSQAAEEFAKIHGYGRFPLSYCGFGSAAATGWGSGLSLTRCTQVYIPAPRLWRSHVMVRSRLQGAR